MSVRPDPAGFVEEFLHRQEHKSLLRFITCGSVDDGKSTLIGRLLYETKLLFDDQLETLEADSRKIGTQNGGLDFALLVDGLAAEREQGITIDVAYRFFTTETRKFIVADTPGHEQYTRNMATGASTADLAVILVDARKGLTQQTRRHSLIVSMLGVRHIVLAVNKMDLVGWSQDTLTRIEDDYRRFAQGLEFGAITCIPMSALTGDNVVVPSAAMPWYDGPSLLEHLETVEVETAAADAPFRMPVQWVNRPNLDFRGYAGLVTGGTVTPGQRVRVLPSGRETTVARIVSYDGDLGRAAEGQSVTLVLAEEVDASRGDVICEAARPAQVTERLSARLFWMADAPLAPGRMFLLKTGAREAVATVAELGHAIDLATLAPQPAFELPANGIGKVVLALDRPIAFDRYADSRETGSFILIDRDSFDTVGMGLIDRALSPVMMPSPVPAEAAVSLDLLEGAPSAPPPERFSAYLAAGGEAATAALIAYAFTARPAVAVLIGLAQAAAQAVLRPVGRRIAAGLSARRRPPPAPPASGRPTSSAPHSAAGSDSPGR